MNEVVKEVFLNGPSKIMRGGGLLNQSPPPPQKNQKKPETVTGPVLFISLLLTAFGLYPLRFILLLRNSSSEITSNYN